MTEIEWIRLVSWPSMFMMIAATYITTLPLAGRRTRDLGVWAMVILSFVLLYISIGAWWQAYNLDAIQSTGFARVFTWSLRLMGMPVGTLLIIVGVNVRTKYG